MATTYSIHGASVQTVVMYKTCLRHHGDQTRGHFLDGCGLFAASGPDGTPEAMVCAACHCHRNFHMRLEVELLQSIPPALPYILPQPQPTQPRYTSHALTPPPSPRIPDPNPQPHTHQEPNTSHQPTNATSPIIIGQAINQAQGVQIRTGVLPYSPEASETQVMETRVKVPKKRLSREQTEKLTAISESNNWKMFREYSKEEIDGVCSEVGIARMTLKGWISRERCKRRVTNVITS